MSRGDAGPPSLTGPLQLCWPALPSTPPLQACPALNTHHDRHRVALILVQLPDARHHCLVVLVAPVSQVEARHIHAAHRQRLEHLTAVAGGADGGHKLGAPRGAGT